MPKIFFLLFVLYSLSASANSCLENASNKELLKELRFRLNSTGGVSDDKVSASFLCGSNATLNVSLINLSSGDKSSYSMPTGNWDTCRNTAKSMNEKIAQQGVGNGLLFAVCVSDATLKKVIISPEAGVKKVDSISTGNWDRCRNAAKEINAF